MNSRNRRTRLGACALALACISQMAVARDAAGDTRDQDSQGPPRSGFAADAEAYVTAPLHWDGKDWTYFGTSIAAIVASHHYDDQVRTHFTTGRYAGNLTSTTTSDAKDALPGLAAIGATWFYATLIEDSSGRREAGEMVESAVLGSASAFVLKYGFRRARPNETADSTQTVTGGNSFPSIHSSAAFAIGTVMAESGSDDVRWMRRVLGYGIGAVTSYERLRHNAHWLSDTVAGASLGIATAHFVMNRHGHPEYTGGLTVTPIDGGVMLAYSTTLSP